MTNPKNRISAAFVEIEAKTDKADEAIKQTTSKLDGVGDAATNAGDKSGQGFGKISGAATRAGKAVEGLQSLIGKIAAPAAIAGALAGIVTRVRAVRKEAEAFRTAIRDTGDGIRTSLQTELALARQISDAQTATRAAEEERKAAIEAVTQALDAQLGKSDSLAGQLTLAFAGESRTGLVEDAEAEIRRIDKLARQRQAVLKRVLAEEERERVAAAERQNREIVRATLLAEADAAQSVGGAAGSERAAELRIKAIRDRYAVQREEIRKTAEAEGEAFAEVFAAREAEITRQEKLEVDAVLRVRDAALRSIAERDAAEAQARRERQQAERQAAEENAAVHAQALATALGGALDQFNQSQRQTVVKIGQLIESQERTRRASQTVTLRRHTGR